MRTILRRFVSSFLILPSVLGTVVSTTLDDASSQIVYAPANQWSAGQDCTTCDAKVDASQAFDGTWHDTTYIPGESTTALTASLTFTGTTVTVYAIVGHGASFSETAVSFSIDGTVLKTINDPTTGSESDFDYNVAVFSQSGLSSGSHTLVIQNGPSSVDSLFLLDRIVFSQDETSSTTAAAGGGTTATATTTATHTTTAAASTAAGTTVQGQSSANGNSVTSDTNVSRTLSSTNGAVTGSVTELSTIIGSGTTSVLTIIQTPASSDSASTDTQQTASHTSHTALIAGIAAAVVVCVILLLLVCFLLRRRSRQRQQSGDGQYSNPPVTMMEAGTGIATMGSSSPSDPFTPMPSAIPTASSFLSRGPNQTLTPFNLMSSEATPMKSPSGQSAYSSLPTATHQPNSSTSMSSASRPWQLAYLETDGSETGSQVSGSHVSRSHSQSSHANSVTPLMKTPLPEIPPDLQAQQSLREAAYLSAENQRLREENQRLRVVQENLVEEQPPPYLNGQ